MANITAYITIGNMEADRGFDPTHWAYLIEDACPTWHIAPVGIYTEDNYFKSRWPTSEESVVHDAMTMVGTVVEELPCLAPIIAKATDHVSGECVDLMRLSVGARQKLNFLNQKIEHKVHLVLTVLTDSIVYAEMHNFVRYPVSVEICTAHYSQDGSLAKFKWPKRKQRRATLNPDQLN